MSISDSRFEIRDSIEGIQFRISNRNLKLLFSCSNYPAFVYHYFRGQPTGGLHHDLSKMVARLDVGFAGSGQLHCIAIAARHRNFSLDSATAAVFQNLVITATPYSAIPDKLFQTPWNSRVLILGLLCLPGFPAFSFWVSGFGSAAESPGNSAQPTQGTNACIDAVFLIDYWRIRQSSIIKAF